MGLYNVTNRSEMQGGQPEDVTDVVANLDAIAAILNGGIDASNIADGSITAAKIAAAAGIPLSKVAALTFFSQITLTATPTDLPWAGGSAAVTVHEITADAGGRTVRRLAAGVSVGQIVIFRAYATNLPVTFVNNAGAGSGAVILLLGSDDRPLDTAETLSLYWNGTQWEEFARDLQLTATKSALLRAGYPRTTKVAVVNQVELMPIEGLINPTYVSDIGIKTTAAGGNSDIGLYYTDDHVNYHLIASSGSLATVNGVHAKSVSRTLINPCRPWRHFYLAFVCNSAGTTFVADDGYHRGRIAAGVFPLADFTNPTLTTPVAALSAADLTLYP